MNNKSDFATIDEYIAAFPPKERRLMRELRAAIRSAAPAAEEKISYHMPTFLLEGKLIYFAAFKNHIGVYAAGSAIRAFKKELSPYAGEKGTLRFPLDKPLPLPLIRKIVKFRVAENLKKAAARGRKKK